MHIYNKKLNGQQHQCEVCGKKPTHIDNETGLRVGSVVQHHVAGRRYDDRCIWVCFKCHAEIHANPKWAYENNYLLKRSNDMLKEKKTKTCSHSKTWNKFVGGNLVIMCSYCGKSVDKAAYGATKKKSDHIPEAGKKMKMGYDDKQPPHIVEAAKLKSRSDVLKALIKKTKDAKKKADFEVEFAQVNKRMRELQKEFDLE